VVVLLGQKIRVTIQVELLGERSARREMMAFSSDILQTTGPTKAQGFYLSYDRDSLPMTVVVVVEFVSSSLSLLKNKIGSSCYTHHQREKFHAWQQQNETEKTFATIQIHSF